MGWCRGAGSCSAEDSSARAILALGCLCRGHGLNLHAGTGWMASEGAVAFGINLVCLGNQERYQRHKPYFHSASSILQSFWPYL